MAKKRTILSLIEEIPESLKAYMDKLEASIVSKEDNTEYSEIDYLLVSTPEYAKEAAASYNAQKNDIKIISVSPSMDIKDFLLGSGRLALNSSILETPFGEIILNKFFRGDSNIHLDETFGEILKNYKDIKITNHLAIGQYADKLGLDAFEAGYNLVSIRSFLDHVIYYLTYLRQGSIAGVPYEVEYGHSDEYFVVNIHTNVKNFVAEYLIDSFGPLNSNDPIQYLMGVAARSTNFLDVTYIENPAKLVLTAYWNKSATSKLNGVSFNNILTTDQTLAQLERKLEDFEYVEEEVVVANLEEKLDKKEEDPLPGSLVELMEPPEGSVLHLIPEASSEIMAFAIAELKEEHPDQSISDIDPEELRAVIKKFPDQSLIEELTEADEEHLIAKVQKSNITQAFEEEVERVKEDIVNNKEVQEKVTNAMNEEIAEQIVEDSDADAINKILAAGVALEEEAEEEREDELINEAGEVTKVVQLYDEERTKVLPVTEKNDAGEFQVIGFKYEDDSELKPGTKIYDENRKLVATIPTIKDKRQSVSNLASVEVEEELVFSAQFLANSEELIDEETGEVSPELVFKTDTGEKVVPKFSEDESGYKIISSFTFDGGDEIPGGTKIFDDKGALVATIPTKKEVKKPSVVNKPAIQLSNDFVEMIQNEESFDEEGELKAKPPLITEDGKKVKPITKKNEETGETVIAGFEDEDGNPVVESTKLYNEKGEKVVNGWSEEEDGEITIKPPKHKTAEISREFVDSQAELFDEEGQLVKDTPLVTENGTKVRPISKVDEETGETVIAGFEDEDGNKLVKGGKLFNEEGEQVVNGWEEDEDGSITIGDPKIESKAISKELIKGKDELFDDEGQLIKDMNLQDENGKKIVPFSKVDEETGETVLGGFEDEDGNKLVKGQKLFDEQGNKVVDGWEEDEEGKVVISDPTIEAIDVSTSFMRDKDDLFDNEGTLIKDAKLQDEFGNTVIPTSVLDEESGQYIFGGFEDEDGNMIGSGGKLFDQGGNLLANSWGTSGDSDIPIIAPPSLKASDIPTGLMHNLPDLMDSSGALLVDIPIFDAEGTKMHPVTSFDENGEVVVDGFAPEGSSEVIPSMELYDASGTEVISGWDPNSAGAGLALESQFDTSIPEMPSQWIPEEFEEPIDYTSIVAGVAEEQEYAQKVEHYEEVADEFSSFIDDYNGDGVDDMMSGFASSFDDDGGSDVDYGSGSKEEKMSGLMSKLNNTLDSNDKTKESPFKSFLNQNAPKEVEKKLSAFATSQGTTVEKLDKKQMNQFAQKEMPGIVKGVVNNSANVEEFKNTIKKEGVPKVEAPKIDENSSEFQALLQKRLQEKLKEIDGVKTKDGKVEVTDEMMKDPKVKAALKDTIQATMNEQSKGDKKEKDSLAGDLAKTFDTSKEKVEKIVDSGAEKAAEVEKKEVTSAVTANAKKVVEENSEPEKEVITKIKTEFKEDPKQIAEINSLKQELASAKAQAEISAKEMAEAKAAAKTPQALKAVELNEVKESEAQKRIEQLEKELVEKGTAVKKIEVQKDESELAEKAEKMEAQLLQLKKDNLAMRQANSKSGMAETQLMQKAKKAEKEKAKLEKMVDALKLKLTTDAAANNKAEEVNEKIEKPDEEKVKEEVKADLPPSDIDDEERDNLVNKLKEGRKPNPEEMDKMAAALEREKELEQQSLEIAANYKKVQHELQQKDMLFKAEMQKAERATQTRDVAIQKAKDSLQHQMDQKDNDINQMKKTIQDLNARMNGDEFAKLAKKAKELEKINENNERAAGVYKDKVDQLMKKEADSKKNDQSMNLATENRNLARDRVQLQNKADTEAKKTKQFEERYNKMRESEAKMRQDKSKADQDARKFEMATKQLEAQVKQLQTANSKVDLGAEMKLKQELKIATDKSNVQAKKLKDMEEKMKKMGAGGGGGAAGGGAAGGAAGGGAKAQQLQQANRKMQKEIADAKAEVKASKGKMMKVKAEQTAMKNKIANLQKELAKAKKKRAA